MKDIGDISEKEGKMEVALQAYTEAGDLYAGEESSSTANACLLKVAEISATLGDHRAAVERFETVGKQSMGNNLLRFSVKGYLLNAGVCRLCYQTADEVKRALEKYDDIDPSFGTSRECVLLNALADAAELGDQDAFASALAEYDSMSRLDPWKTKLLLIGETENRAGGGGRGRPDVIAFCVTHIVRVFFAKRASFDVRRAGTEPRDAEIFVRDLRTRHRLTLEKKVRCVRHNVATHSSVPKNALAPYTRPPTQTRGPHSGVSAPSMTPSLHTSPKTPPAVTCAPAPGPRMMSGVDSISAE